MKNITKRKIKNTPQVSPLEKTGRNLLKKARRQPLLAGALVGASLLATVVGTSVYLWQRRKAKKQLDVGKIKVAIIKDMKEAGNEVNRRLRTWRSGK
jgi:hypothetical protein